MLYRQRIRRGGLAEEFTCRSGEFMATGREKDRKTRRKHRKNVARKKGLAKARRGKKTKKG